ncbi:MAG: hydantoinase B/oxoprolinase family protein [Chloroflexi bacterium]|nr:hydantoinase B/oxoprolinase family protein [Chloroflexota bacterium]
MHIDPITLELINHSLACIADEMALTTVRASYSSNLKGSMDLSAALCDRHGELIVQGLTLPMHLGSIPDAIEAIKCKFGGSINPGDMFILNDPFDGGTHLPDIYLLKPVFVDGGLVAYACSIAHHSDIGGKVAGGNGCDATEIYQEGLRIPPLKLYDGGVPNEAITEILERNVRVPVQVMGDLRAQLAACHVGERSLLGLVSRYGAAGFERYTAELLDYTERLARQAIRALPDGTYSFTDYLDDDGIDPGPFPITVAVTVEGDSLRADFTGTALQVKGGINSPIPFTKSATYACVRCLMDPHIPNNAGFFRPIEVVAPPGTLVNPVLPAAVAARGLTGFRIANVVMGALAQAAPDRIPAAEVGGDTGVSIGGYYADRRPFVFLEFLLASWGGRPNKDGIDGNSSVVVNFSNNPVEVIEAEQPLRIEQYGFVPDSGGPGKYRGGLALVRDYRFLGGEATLQIRSDRRVGLPYGLAGGRPGTPSLNILNPDGENRVLPAKPSLTIHHGDVYRHILAGAGGHGDRLERDPARVLEDVLDEKITPAYALREYGVVIGPEAGALDEARTKRERRRRASKAAGR